MGLCGSRRYRRACPAPIAALALQRAAAVPGGDGEHRQGGLHGGPGGLALRGAARLRQRPQGLHREQPRRDLPEPRRCRGTGRGAGTPGTAGPAAAPGGLGLGLGEVPVPGAALGGAVWEPEGGLVFWNACVCPAWYRKFGGMSKGVRPARSALRCPGYPNCLQLQSSVLP